MTNPRYAGMMKELFISRVVPAACGLSPVRPHEVRFVAACGEEDSVAAAARIERMKAECENAYFRMTRGGRRGFPDAFNRRLAGTRIPDFGRGMLEKE